jgi:hypothetical protein
MTTLAQTSLLFHGTVILLGSMLTGFPLAIAAANGWPPEAIHAWAVTHASLASSGILLIAIGAAAHRLAFSPRQAAWFGWTMLSSVYLLCAGLVVSAVTGMHGLTPDGPLFNRFLHVCNDLGVLGALVAGVLLVRAAHAAMSAERSPVETHKCGDPLLEAHPR